MVDIYRIWVKKQFVDVGTMIKLEMNSSIGWVESLIYNGCEDVRTQKKNKTKKNFAPKLIFG